MRRLRTDSPFLILLLFFLAFPLEAQKSDYGLVSLASSLKAEIEYDSLTGYGWINRSDIILTFATGVPWIIWDWSERQDVSPPVDTGSGPIFDASFRAVVEKGLAERERIQTASFRVATILIDAGHGGKDSGAVGEHDRDGTVLRVLEKDVNLKIALAVHESLKSRFPDRRILLTRDRDVSTTLEERVVKANSEKLPENHAIIYVSIHSNASFNKNARGFEVWYLNPEYRRSLMGENKSKTLDESIVPIMNAMLEEEFLTESIFLARMILGRMDKSIGKESLNRGMRAEEWFVVRNARMPSVLIETGFITNPEEAALLADDAYLQRLSDAIYTGISDFVLYFEGQKDSPRK